MISIYIPNVLHTLRFSRIEDHVPLGFGLGVEKAGEFRLYMYANQSQFW
jgi:hypothetical protein